MSPCRDRLFAGIIGGRLLIEGGREGIGGREDALIELICDCYYYTLWPPSAELAAELPSTQLGIS